MGYQKGIGEARGCAHEGGDPIQFEIPEFGVQLRVQDDLSFKFMYRMHTTSDLDVLHM
jgi:hypothetical protein